MSLPIFHELRDTVPTTFICPATWILMKDPVVDPYGISYDKSSIEAMRAIGMQVPTTVPNRALKNTIEEYTQEVGIPSNVIRSLWKSSPAIRVRVYGEFAQWLDPATPYSDLQRLTDIVKGNVEQIFLSTADRNPSITSPRRLIETALFNYSSMCHREAHVFDPRIARERYSRWPL